ncbi:MAG: hypothetical protein JF597_49845, partial [Streptomyces sp.]|nr:hypothetical protein [Streptomyces sp.]
SGWFRVSVVVHVAAASVWLGCVLRVVAARAERRRDVLTRVAPLAVTSAVAVAVSGIAQALADRVRVDGIAFDRLVLVKAVLLVLATSLGAYGGGRLRSLELIALVAAAGIGAALTALPSAPPAGRPILTAAGTLVPQRPGTNYLHGDGQWQRLELPAGRSTLRLARGTLLVDTGHRRGLQPDGPECATALLVRPSLDRCPDQVLEPEDGASLQALTGWLRGRGLTRVRLQGDHSPRSRAATALLGAGTTSPQALVLTGTWESAAATLGRMGRRVPEGGVYLAPWLMAGPLLTAYATMAPLVVLPFDPTGADALRYAAALPEGEVPTAAGYRAWGGAMSTPRVWATAPASVFPRDLGHDHAAANGWFPGGALVPVGDLHSYGSREQGGQRSTT